MLAVFLAPFGDIGGGDGFASGGNCDVHRGAGCGCWSCWRGCGCRWLDWLFCGGRGGGGSFEFSDDRANRDFLALLDDNTEHAVGLGLKLVGDLVGLQAGEWIALFDGVAVVLVPFRDVRRGDGFAGGRHFDIDGHCGR